MNHNAFDLPAQVDRGWQTMATLGSAAYFLLKGAGGVSHKLVGRIVEASEDSVVVALLSSEVPAGISQILTVPAASSQPSLTFLRIATSDFSSVTPAGWPRCNSPSQTSHLLGCLARPRRSFFGEQRSREASGEGQRSFQNSARRYGPASQDSHPRLRRRHRRVLRGWRRGSPFSQDHWVASPGCQGSNHFQNGGRAEAKEEGDGSFRRPHDYDGARVGSRPKSRRPDAYDDDELHAEPADPARPQGAQVVGKKQRFHRPWWFQLRERQRQRCHLWKRDESCGDTPSPAPADQASARQHLQEVREGDHHRVGDCARPALGLFVNGWPNSPGGSSVESTGAQSRMPLPTNIYATVSTKWRLLS